MIEVKPARIPNFEILRILAMLMIVGAHANQWGFFYRNDVNVVFSWDNLFNSITFVVLTAFSGGFGVNCFVLISSYFFAGKNSLKCDKMVNLWLQVFFYSFGIALIFAAFGMISIGDTVQYLTPIYHDSYWFITKYLGFLLIVPFLSMFFERLEQKHYHAFFISMILLSVTIAKNIPYGNVFVQESSGSSLILWAFLFGIASYARKFGLPAAIERNRWLLLICLIAVQVAGGIVINVVGKEGYLFSAFSSSANGLSFFTSILFFLCIKEIKVDGNRRIIRCMTYMAPMSFGVYMIHEHPLMRQFIWGGIVNMPKAFHSWYYLPYVIAVVLGVYMICALIDVFRRWIFKVLGIESAVGRCFDKLNTRFAK